MRIRVDERTILRLICKAINYYFLAIIINWSHGFTVPVAKQIWNSERAFVCISTEMSFITVYHVQFTHEQQQVTSCLGQLQRLLIHFNKQFVSVKVKVFREVSWSASIYTRDGDSPQGYG